MCLDIVSTRKRSRLGLGSSGLGLSLGLDPEGLGPIPACDCCISFVVNNILVRILCNRNCCSSNADRFDGSQTFILDRVQYYYVQF